MDEKVYLVNPKTGSRFALGGFKPAARSSTAPKFASARKYGNQNLPASVDLRPGMTAVENQRETQSCVANALAGAYEFLIKKKSGKDIDVSRLFIYYNARIKDGAQEYNIADHGSSVSGAIEGLREYGCCNEEMLPYDISKINQTPPPPCYADAVNYRITDGMQINTDLNEMKACLAENYPFAFGMVTFTSFAEAETNSGRVPMPRPNEALGAQHSRHAMLVVGYNDRLQHFIVKNSWGANWGDQGYGYIPYNYMCNPQLCEDMHTIKTISENVRRRVEADTRTPNDRRRVEADTRTTNVTRDRRNNPDDPLFDYSQNFYDDTDFWNQETSYDNYNTDWPTDYSQSYEFSGASSQQAYFERTPRGNSTGKSYVLWIDKKSEENAQIAKQLTSDQHTQVDFAETFSAALNHLQQHRDKIKSPSSTFQVICRGYYKSENRNPLDLLAFLNQHHLKHIRVIVFTQDEHGLKERLKHQAPSMHIQDWKDRLYITDDSRNLVTKCQSNTGPRSHHH